MGQIINCIMEKLLKIAKSILDINPNSALTGTLMLKLRGINLGREPHDIDILLCDYAPNIKFPDDLKVKHIGLASDGSGSKYEYDGIIIDILSSNEEHDVIDGLRLGSVEKLMDAKYRYSLQNFDNSTKHHDDLVKMGFKFPTQEEVGDSLPF